MVKGRSFAAIAAIVGLLLLLTAAVIFFAPAGVAVAQESGGSGEPQGDAWYLILILAILVFGEIVGVIAIKRGDKKRAKDKEDKDNKGLAAAMFGGALPAWQIGALIALEVVFVVLAVYIIYLLRRSPKAAVAADIACDESQEDAQAKEQAAKEQATAERAYEEAPASIAAPEESESANGAEETPGESKQAPEEIPEESGQAPEEIPEESEQAPEEIPEESGQAPEEIPEESEQPPAEIEPQESEDEKLLSAFKNAKGLKLSRSFTAKLILASFESKEYFAQLSNALLAHKKVKCRIGWNDAVFNRGRTKIAKMTLRGKTLWLFLPLEAEKQEEKYRCVDQSDKVKYQAVPCGMKIKSGRGVKRALELIQKVAEQNGLSPAPPARLFAAAEYPEDSVKNIIARDLIRVYPKQKKLPEELEELLEGESYTPSSFLSPFRTSRGRVEIEHGEENWKKTPAARERILQASASMGKVFNSRFKREK